MIQKSALKLAQTVKLSFGYLSWKLTKLAM